MSDPSPEYAARVAVWHRELGISERYGPDRRLALQMEAGIASLTTIAKRADGTEVRLTPTAAQAWRDLHDAAAHDGVTLLPLSGFRSVGRQVEIIRHKLETGFTIEEILKSVAAPGYSEHHTGHALDLGTPGDPPFEPSFAKTRAFEWLNTHAQRHGWLLSYPKSNPHGIVFEPWHWIFKP